MTQYIGQQFGDYRLTEYLGGGGFADVYLGQHIYLSTKEHPVEAAIKVLKGPFIAKEIAEFRNEAQTILRLEHPHIVRLITFSVAKIQEQEVPFLVMPYALYGSLDKRHPRGTKVPLLTIISYIKQIAEALQYAHDQKVVHRDIKPANFLLTENEKVLLSDFGIAVTAHRTTSWVKQNVAGTEAYMAPEQFHAEARIESDQYSLGVVVYQWLCGELPFAKGNLGYQHNFASPPLLHEKIPIHSTVEDVILKVLAKDPKERYPSITNFVDALEQAWQSMPLAGTSLSIYQCRDGQVRMVKWSSDSSRIACLVMVHIYKDGQDTGLDFDQVRDATNGDIISTYSGHFGSASWSPDGTHIALIPYKTVEKWNISTANVTKIYQNDVMLWSISWSPDGTRIAFTGVGNDTVWVCDAISGEVISICSGYSKSGGSIASISWSPNGQYVALDGYGPVYIWDTTSRSISIFHGYDGYGHALRCLDWSPDSTRIVSASGYNNTVQVWDASTGKLAFTYSGHSKQIEDVAWAPDGTRIASGSEDKAVQIWDATTGASTATYYGLTGRLKRIAWSPNGIHIAFVGYDHTGNQGTVQIWNAATAENIFMYSVGSLMSPGLVWSPDGTRIAFNNDDTVQVWQVVDYENERLNR